MASFVNFGGFDPSPRNFLARQQAREQQARQLGRDIGAIGGGMFDLYKKQKAQETMKDIMEAWDFDDKYSERLSGITDESIRSQLTPEQIDPSTVEISKLGQTFEPDVEVSLTPETEFQILEDGSTFVPVPAVDFDPTGKRFAPGAEIPLTPETEFQILEDDSIYFPKKQQEITNEMIAAEKERQISELFGDPSERERYDRLKEIYKPGSTDEQKYRRAAALLAPYDEEGAAKMIKYADERSALERQLGAKEQAAATKSKVDAQKNAVIRAENALGKTNSSINQLTSQYAALVSQGRIDEASEIQDNIDDLNAIKNAQWNRLSRLSPADYPSLKNAKGPKDSEVIEDHGTGDDNIDKKLLEVAKESVLDDGTLDNTKLLLIADPVQRKRAEDMANKILDTKRGNIEFKEKQKQAKLQTATAEESLEAKKIGSEGERTALGFWEEANAANTSIVPVPFGEASRYKGDTGIKIVDLYRGNATVSPGFQAALQWVMPILREDSGAAIGKEEVGNFIDTYIPVSGDSKEVIERKERARKLKLNALKTKAGRAYTNKYGKSDKKPKPEKTESRLEKLKRLRGKK